MDEVALQPGLKYLNPACSLRVVNPSCLLHPSTQKMNQGSAKRRRLQYDDESYIAGPSSQSQPYFPASGQHLQSSYIIPSHVDLTHVSQRVLESGSQTIQQLQNPQPFGSGFFGFDNRSVPGVSDVMLQTTQQPQLFAGDIFDFSVPTASGIPKTTMASFSDFQLAPSDRYIQQPPILPQPWIRTQYQKDAPILPPLHVNLVPSIKPIQMLQLQLPALKINPKIICFGRVCFLFSSHRLVWFYPCPS